MASWIFVFVLGLFGLITDCTEGVGIFSGLAHGYGGGHYGGYGRNVDVRVVYQPVVTDATAQCTARGGTCSATCGATVTTAGLCTATTVCCLNVEVHTEVIKLVPRKRHNTRHSSHANSHVSRGYSSNGHGTHNQQHLSNSYHAPSTSYHSAQQYPSTSHHSPQQYPSTSYHSNQQYPSTSHHSHQQYPSTSYHSHQQYPSTSYHTVPVGVQYLVPQTRQGHVTTTYLPAGFPSLPTSSLVNLAPAPHYQSHSHEPKYDVVHAGYYTQDPHGDYEPRREPVVSASTRYDGISQLLFHY